jgi:radical SAM superfamily enzyme YgiQ (UPF0313 family)
MKALLIFVPFVTNVGIPPLSLALLKSCLKTSGVEASTVDLNIKFQQYCKTVDNRDLSAWLSTPDMKIDFDSFRCYTTFLKDAVSDILGSCPEVVGISVFSIESQRFTEDLCYYIKQCSPTTHIVIGGSGLMTVRAYFKKSWGDLMLESGLVDCAVFGEAELYIGRIFKNKLTGIQFVEQINNDELSDLPVPNFDDYDLNAYGPRDQLQLPITASKGCVRKCTFCDVASIWPKFRYRRGENVADEIIGIYQRYGIKNFAFTDSLINGGLRPFREMNQILTERIPHAVKYSGQFICRDSKSMPPSDFALMKSGGCWSVNIGIESGSETVRTHMKKGFSDIDLHYTAEQLLNNDIAQFWNLIVGYPTETDADWDKTIQLIEQYKNHNKQIKIIPIGVFQMLSDTPITQHNMLDELQVEITPISGYSEYNWVSHLNKSNTFRSRVDRWIELVDLLKKYNMLGSSADRIDQKTRIIQSQLDYYETTKSSKTIFPIQQQSFQAPSNFVD